MKRRAIATILSVMMLLSLLTAYPTIISVGAVGEVQTITATAEDDYGSGSEANLTITAPTSVVVGETFEIIYQFHDYVTSTGNPGCFVIDSTIDTNYVALDSSMIDAAATAVIEEPTTVYWENCCNTETVGETGWHTISFVTIEEDSAIADTLTVK
ncbi:MAG: hypothetical protein IJN86_08305, partial [Clostridia bacterium]|nr:hypothetical protein [Clostridia bacterium]